MVASVLLGSGSGASSWRYKFKRSIRPCGVQRPPRAIAVVLSRYSTDGDEPKSVELPFGHGWSAAGLGSAWFGLGGAYLAAGRLWSARRFASLRTILAPSDCMRDEINQTAAAGGLAERSGLHVALTFHLYFLELEDASDRAIFKEAYARASRYNQTICDERNGNESVRSESAENEEDGPSTEGGEVDDESET